MPWNLAKPDLLIIDEHGCGSINIDGARLLYRVMSVAYEARSANVTANTNLRSGGAVLGDVRLATATIDCIMR